MKKLSVIIPAYNEENRIGKTLEYIDAYLKKQAYDYEIIVVIDGARDNTEAVVKDFASRVQKLRLISNKENYGKGYVVRQGMLIATGDIRLFMDADNSTTIDQIETMLPYLNQSFDVVIGSIEIAGAKIHENAQWYRRFVGHWSKYLIRIVANLWHIHDTQRGFKLFSEKAAVELFSRATINRFGFDIEILAIAKHIKMKVKEVSVIWNNSDESKVHLGDYISTLIDLCRIRTNLWKGKYN